MAKCDNNQCVQTCIIIFFIKNLDFEFKGTTFVSNFRQVLEYLELLKPLRQLRNFTNHFSIYIFSPFRALRPEG